MKWRELRPFVWIAAAMLGLVVGYECAVRYVGVGSAKYVVTVDSTDPKNISDARYAWADSREEAVARIATVAEHETFERYSESEAADITGYSFSISSTMTSRLSPMRVAANEYTFYEWVILFIELDDGSRWATVEPVPNPRDRPRVITTRLSEGRQLPLQP